jgi:hypothetical protein
MDALTWLPLVLCGLCLSLISSRHFRNWEGSLLYKEEREALRKPLGDVDRHLALAALGFFVLGLALIAVRYS